MNVGVEFVDSFLASEFFGVVPAEGFDGFGTGFHEAFWAMVRMVWVVVVVAAVGVPCREYFSAAADGEMRGFFAEDGIVVDEVDFIENVEFGFVLEAEVSEDFFDDSDVAVDVWIGDVDDVQ